MRNVMYVMFTCLVLAFSGGCTNTALQTKKTRVTVEKLDYRYKSLTAQAMPIVLRYRADRAAFRQRVSQTRALLREYVQIVSLPREQQPNEWHYAALYRSAHITEALALTAKRLGRAYRNRGKARVAQAFGLLHKRFMKAAYTGYMLVLFAGWYSHTKHPSVKAHAYGQNSWLRRSNTSRCTRRAEAGITASVHHDNLVWTMLDKQSGAVGTFTGPQKRELMTRLLQERRYQFGQCP